MPVQESETGQIEAQGCRLWWSSFFALVGFPAMTGKGGPACRINYHASPRRVAVEVMEEESRQQIELRP